MLAVVLSTGGTARATAPWCTGDCDGDSVVSIEEVQRCVNAFLSGSAADCPACDRLADGTIEISDIQAAVLSFLTDVSSCPPVATQPASATPTPTEDTTTLVMQEVFGASGKPAVLTIDLTRSLQLASLSLSLNIADYYDDLSLTAAHCDSLPGSGMALSTQMTDHDLEIEMVSAPSGGIELSAGPLVTCELHVDALPNIYELFLQGTLVETSASPALVEGLSTLNVGCADTERVPGAGCPTGGCAPREFQVNVTTLGYQENPSVSSDAAGNFVVVWKDYAYAAGRIVGRRFDSTGQALSGEFAVTADAYGVLPSVSRAAAGAFVVVWQSENYFATRVLGRRFSSIGDALGTEFQVNTATDAGGYYPYPKVASSDAGDFVVVWTGPPGYPAYGYGSIFGRRYASTGDPLSSEFQVVSGSAEPYGSATVGRAADGDFEVAWTRLQAYDYGDIVGLRFADDGRKLGVRFRINSVATGAQDVPCLASDRQGDFAVVWRSLDDEGYWSLMLRRYDRAGRALGAEFQIDQGFETTADETDTVPTLSLDADGDMLAVWTTRCSSLDLIGRRFTSTGHAVGSAFQVNTHMEGYQMEPSVAPLGDQQFVVVWASDYQDGDSLGVFGRIFGPP